MQSYTRHPMYYLCRLSFLCTRAPPERLFISSLATATATHNACTDAGAAAIEDMHAYVLGHGQVNGASIYSIYFKWSVHRYVLTLQFQEQATLHGCFCFFTLFIFRFRRQAFYHSLRCIHIYSIFYCMWNVNFSSSGKCCQTLNAITFERQTFMGSNRSKRFWRKL